jgi:hypothetical protein
MTTAGAVTHFPVPGSGPGHGITSGSDGRVWFVYYPDSTIGAITSNGRLTEYHFPGPRPVTSINLLGITSGPDGALWFTEIDANRVGRITTAGEITEYDLSIPDSSPAFITTGPDGAVRFTAGQSNWLGRIVLPHYVTTTTLASNPNPSIYGQRITLTAQVSSLGPNTPTGSVSFRSLQNGSNFTLATVPLNASGVATLSRSNLTALYPYPITAQYRGDGWNEGSTSGVLNQIVKQTTSAATITSSANPSTRGQAVTFTAKITSPTVTPTGLVTFTTGTTVLGAAQLSGGKAVFTISTLPVGANSMKVTFPGNSNIAGSAAGLIQNVQ